MKQLGRLKPGANADITIFDPDTVTDNAVAETGKDDVAVNGYSLCHCQWDHCREGFRSVESLSGTAIKGGHSLAGLVIPMKNDRQPNQRQKTDPRHRYRRFSGCRKDHAAQLYPQ